MTAPTIEPLDLRTEIKALIEREGLSQRLIARESGIGETVLNQWLADKYPGDNAVVLSVPGAMDSGLETPLFWASLVFALAVAFVVTVPINRWMISRGLGHATVHHVHR